MNNQQNTTQNTNSNIKQKPKLVLFDLDHTLLPIDSDQTWGQFLYEQGVVDDEHQAKNQQFYLDYTQGKLDLNNFLSLSFAALAAHSRDELAVLQAKFIEEKIKPHITNAAKYLLKQHSEDVCLLVTATNSFVTLEIAKLFGFMPEYLVATEPQTIDHEIWWKTNAAFNGSIHGVPCFREKKIVRIEEKLNELKLQRQDFSSVWAYSDSHNDIPMLEFADKAIATNPDATLSAYAKQKSWSRLYLFKPSSL